MSVVQSNWDPMSTPMMSPNHGAFLLTMRQAASSETVLTTGGPHPNAPLAHQPRTAQSRRLYAKTGP